MYLVNKTESKGFTVYKATPAITIDAPDAVDANANATIVVRINQTATGNITLTVNGTRYNATIENGVAVFVIDKLLSGKYDVTAEYDGDRNYTAAAVTLTEGLTVDKVSCYQINVTANDTKVGWNSTITVRVPADAVGNVSIYVDGVLVENVTVLQGIAQLNVTMPYGNHTVNVTFTDDKYGFRYAIADFWVFKYVGDDGDHAVFAYNSESKLAAATPYIVAVPDDSWAGNDCSLEGKTLAFNAENAVVSKEVPTVVSSDNLRFVGTYAGGRNLSNAYVLNGEGTYFTPNSSINPFNAYVQKKDGTAASARINISFADDAVASVDGISTSFDCNSVHTVFDLSGRMLSTQVGKVPSTLPKGIYIVNGKKVVVR
jgi:hypothetical protein